MSCGCRNVRAAPQAAVHDEQSANFSLCPRGSVELQRTLRIALTSLRPNAIMVGFEDLRAQAASKILGPVGTLQVGEYHYTG